MNINEKIFALISEHNVTQKEFASAIHASTGLVTDWKNNRSTPKMKYICLIADYFGVTVDYLLGRDSPAAGMELSPDEEEFLSLFRQLDPIAQKKIEDYAHDLIASGKYTSSTPAASGE